MHNYSPVSDTSHSPAPFYPISSCGKLRKLCIVLIREKSLRGEGMEDNLWQAVLGEIELTVSRASFITWFKNTRMLRHKDNVLVVGVPNVFIKQQLERKYHQLIVDTIHKKGVTLSGLNIRSILRSHQSAPKKRCPSCAHLLLRPNVRLLLRKHLNNDHRDSPH